MVCNDSKTINISVVGSGRQVEMEDGELFSVINVGSCWLPSYTDIVDIL